MGGEARKEQLGHEGYQVGGRSGATWLRTGTALLCRSGRLSYYCTEVLSPVLCSQSASQRLLG